MSAKSIWKGMLTVSALNVPVALYKATDDRETETKTHYVHDVCKQQTNQKNVCLKCNVDVPFANIARGVPNGDGTFTVLTNDEIKSIRPATSDALYIERFVPDAQVSNPLWIDCIYFLVPVGRHAVEGYATIAEALRQTSRAAQGLLTLYGSERPVAVRAIDGRLVVQSMRTKSLVRDASDLPNDVAPGAAVPVKANVQLAVQLIKSKLGDYDPTDYEDAYVEEFNKLVEAKRRGETINTAVAVPAMAPSADLMSALRASLDANAAVMSASTGAKKVKAPKESVAPKAKSTKKTKVA
jgi:DNA end-binding protein Ku